MKRTITGISLLLAVLVPILFGCEIKDDSLDQALHNYAEAVSEELPEDLCLTIYYLPMSITTRMPLTAEGLISHPNTVKIVVGSDELVKHRDLLQKISVSSLETNKRDPLIDARLYYVLSTDENDELLNVMISGGALDRRDPIVNGIHVMNCEVIYDLLAPFLSEKICDMFGI